MTDVDTSIVMAEPADIDRLGQLIAGAFLHLKPSKWLVDNPNERGRIFHSGYFALWVEQALVQGSVYMALDRDTVTGVALWLPARAKPLAGYDERLRVITGDHVDRFRLFDEVLETAEPPGPHDHLTIIAVRPDRQSMGLGIALLERHHLAMDAANTTGYLEAAGLEQRDYFLRRGWRDSVEGPIVLPAPRPQVMYPMWRYPHR